MGGFLVKAVILFGTLTGVFVLYRARSLESYRVLVSFLYRSGELRCGTGIHYCMLHAELLPSRYFEFVHLELC